MTDPSWPSSPPEANYLRLVGPGANGTATTLASAGAWQAMATSNEIAFAASSLNLASTTLGFQGLGGAASTAAAVDLNGSLQTLACWVQEKPPILASAVAAYETAVSAMIPAEVSLANRTTQASHVALNPLLMGALTPIIATLDAEYFGEHWPQNASAGAAYGSVLAALVSALTVPVPLAPAGVSPAGPQLGLAATAESAGTTMTSEVMKVAGESAMQTSAGAAPADAIGQALAASVQPLQSAVQPIMGMFQAPVQALQGLGGLPQAMLGRSAGQLGSGAAEGPDMPGLSVGSGGYGGSPIAGPSAGGLTAGAGWVGGVNPGSGLTNFTRPTSCFAPENGGRPLTLNSGLLSASEAAMSPAVRGGGAPLSPAPLGMLGHSKGDGGKESAPRVRVVASPIRPGAPGDEVLRTAEGIK